MDDDIAKLLLDGITQKEFVVFYLVGISGILIRVLINVSAGIKTNEDTPYKFEFKYFMKGFIRLIVSCVLMALIVARFPEYSHQLVDMEPVFTHPTRLAEGNSVEVVAKMTAGLAFTMGMGIDEIVKRLISSGAKALSK